jgi:NAD(P)-dependent dehydrogenase (short-subunit alcohol dehydrogenase family)
LNRRVLIVGASRGIGLGFAGVFSRNGWEVHATVRNDAGEEKLSRMHDNISIHRLDVRHDHQITQLARQFDGKSIDILIHNAGVYGKDMNEKDMFRINSVAPFNVATNLLPIVVRSEQRKIALLTSKIGARNGGPTPSDTYGKSKCALNDRFRKIEPSWRSQGVISVVLHPGWVATDMGGPSAPVSVLNSVEGIYQVLQGLKPAESGCFLTWEGKKHPW